LDASALGSLEQGYEVILALRGSVDKLPKNGEGKELWNRRLDCAVINMVHALRTVTHSEHWLGNNRGMSRLASYDTVRGAFWEGSSLKTAPPLVHAILGEILGDRQ